MSSTPTSSSGLAAGISPRVAHFARHYVEMVLVMFAGMAVLPEIHQQLAQPIHRAVLLQSVVHQAGNRSVPHREFLRSR